MYRGPFTPLASCRPLVCKFNRSFVASNVKKRRNRSRSKLPIALCFGVKWVRAVRWWFRLQCELGLGAFDGRFAFSVNCAWARSMVVSHAARYESDSRGSLGRCAFIVVRNWVGHSRVHRSRSTWKRGNKKTTSRVRPDLRFTATLQCDGTLHLQLKIVLLFQYIIFELILH